MSVRRDPDGRQFAVSYDSGAVHIHSRQGELICTLHNPIKAKKGDPFSAGGVVAWSPSGDQLLTANGPLLRLWNAADWTLAASNLDLEWSDSHWFALFGPDPGRITTWTRIDGWHLTRFALTDALPTIPPLEA